MRGALAAREVDVVGATTWLWTREDMADSVDVLFVDEAGQMSLANAVAASPAADSLILLGDPQQLDQPLQGSHPPGADRSALAHLLDTSQTMPGRLGLFLERTWRLHPAICAYTSEVFYENRLEPEAGRERQRLAGIAPLTGAGLRFVGVPHEGNDSESVEEAAAVARLVGELVASGATWIDAHGDEHPVAVDDVLIITPYNAQVAAVAAVAARRERGHRGQVPGPGEAGLDLLHGHQLGRRRAARHGVPLQPEPSQRGHLTRPMRDGRRRQPRPPARPLSHSPSDAPRQRPRPPRGDGRALEPASRRWHRR